MTDDVLVWDFLKNVTSFLSGDTEHFRELFWHWGIDDLQTPNLDLIPQLEVGTLMLGCVIPLMN